MGEISDQERQEVECMSHIYPEISTYLEETQALLERLAFENAEKTPARLKDHVMEVIAKTPQEYPSKLKVVKGGGQENTISPARLRSYQLGVAAGFLLLIASGVMILFMRQENEVLAEGMTEIQIEKDRMVTLNEELSQQIGAFKIAVEEKDYISALLASRTTQQIALKGTNDTSAVPLRVFWNPSTKNVLVKVDALPPLPADKDYQLWAIVDGQPSDMGVLDLNSIQEEPQLLSLLIDHASAFAVTVEPKGGRPTPTLAALAALGKI